MRAPLTSSFKDCVATIRRTSVEFQYQLVVTRAYEEGEEQLLEEDAESGCYECSGSALTTGDDERVFLIDHALGFRFGALDGDATFAWRDLSGDEGDLWEFIANKVRAPRGPSLISECRKRDVQVVRGHALTVHLREGRSWCRRSLTAEILSVARPCQRGGPRGAQVL
jgi:hypothetical protein